jgi:ATP phosphoribosyltransferase
MKNKLKLALPKGRLLDGIIELLEECGLEIKMNGRSYRPWCADPEVEIKILKPQNIPALIELGSQDLAFTGYDWVTEQNACVEELFDLKFDPVKIVAAIPKEKSMNKLKTGVIRVVSEYENIAKKYLKEKGYKYQFIRSYGATEVFVPEDADMIVDNSSTGKTLVANNLKIVDTILVSSTRMVANKKALKDSWKQRKIENLLLLIKSVLEARVRVLLEMNVAKERLSELMLVLPCMKSPTVAELYKESGYAVKVAVKKAEVKDLIPILKENGATDILVYKLEKVVS